MRELAIVSGKGGAGKTSLAASLAALSRPVVLADCDVDAPDLHLVLDPQVRRRADYVGGAKARVLADRCVACGKCVELCRFEAIRFDGPCGARAGRTYRVDALGCEGCGVCADWCAEGAIEMRPAICGQWFVSETRCGPMIHARLAVGAENSGKLVTQLRRAARQIAETMGLDRAICDASPGIGCPVIASLTGASLALIVAEPTVAGMHDFERIARLCTRLGIPGLMVVNKADLNGPMAERLRTAAERFGIRPIGEVPYDRSITRAQVAARSVVELGDGPAAREIRAIRERLEEPWDRASASQAGGLVDVR